MEARIHCWMTIKLKVTQHLPCWVRKTTKKPQSGWSAPGFEPGTSRMRVSCVTTEPPCSVVLYCKIIKISVNILKNNSPHNIKSNRLPSISEPKHCTTCGQRHSSYYEPRLYHHHHQSILPRAGFPLQIQEPKFQFCPKADLPLQTQETKGAVLLGINRYSSFLLLSALHSLFSIWTNLKKS